MPWSGGFWLYLKTFLIKHTDLGGPGRSEGLLNVKISDFWRD